MVADPDYLYYIHKERIVVMDHSLQILGKRIDLAASKVLWDKPFSADSLADHWNICIRV